MATNPNPGIGPTGPRDEDGQVVSTAGGAATQTKKENVAPTEENSGTQKPDDVGPVGPRKKA